MQETMKILVEFLLITAIVKAVPVPAPRDSGIGMFGLGDGNSSEEGPVLYDQRQEGEWNVRADLKNFIILIIPQQAGAPTSTAPTPSLLDFLGKAVPKRGHHSKRTHGVKKGHESPVPSTQETQHFIESKTAPYHVDISTSRTHLAKLHPTSEPIVVNGEEIVIAKSPNVALVKEAAANVAARRNGRAFVFTVTQDDEEKLLLNNHNKKTDDEQKKTINKKKVKENFKTELKLLGAEHEQCGPGLARDSYGICRVIKD